MKWENSINIDRASKDVFKFVTDPNGGTKWHHANKIEPISKGPIKLGSTYRVTGKYLLWKYDSVSEVIDFKQNNRVTYRSDAGMYTYTLRYLLEPSGNGTKFTEVGEADPKGLLKLMINVVMGGAKMNSERGLTLLKETLEN